MSIDVAQVRHVARLARLALDDETAEKLAGELGSILAMVDDMAAIDTEGVEPMANPFDATQPLRTDEITEPDRREVLQNGAPATERGLYLVPKVID